jgi:hypothetical protein
MALKTADPLGSVWGSGPNDVFAVGYEGTILHYDGQSWQSVVLKTGFLEGVWRSGPNDVFAVGIDGTLLHYDGISWLKLNARDSAHFLGMWGKGSTFYVVGTSGTIYRHF